MGGIVGHLLGLYCASGCQASVIASSLAFHPPDPYYRFNYDEQKDSYALEMLEDIPSRCSKKLTVHLIETKNKTKVPIFFFHNPLAEHTILFSHGNATDCGGMLPLYEILVMALRVNVVAYDYTGYGVSKHFGVAPTEKQTYQDIEAVYQWILDQKIVKDPSKELVLYGQSVGSGPSCFLAATNKKPIAGLILHSPIMSGLRVLTDSRALACFDIFPNIDRMAQVAVPVMIFHGEADEEVAVSHGQRLHAAVRESCRYEAWWVPRRGHNDILVGHEQDYLNRIKAFLEHLQLRYSHGQSTASEANSSLLSIHSI